MDKTTNPVEVCARERRVYGPPGTGKTTFVTRQIEIDGEKYGADKVWAASFTKAAAVELLAKAREKGLRIDKHQLATLHSHAFRALDAPKLAEAHTAEWNAAEPRWALSASKTISALDEPHGAAEAVDDDEAQGPRGGDELLHKAQVYRARMMPQERWPLSVAQFQKAWDRWKREMGYLDFTDLIETCLEDVETAPGDPAVGFADEAQDFTALQLALVRKWCRRMDTYTVVGDDDQTIYTWVGARPDAFLSPQLEPEQERVLAQSHRVPQKVHALAQRIALRISRRRAKDYRPTKEVGSVEMCVASWKVPRPAVQLVEEALGRGEKCMILASCSYLLKPTIRELRDRGVPFRNEYRRSRGDWNPLARGDTKRTTAVDRILALLSTDPDAMDRPKAEWTWTDVWAWAKPLRAEAAFHSGGKAQLERIAMSSEWANQEVEVWDLSAVMKQEAIARLYAHDLDWYRASIVQSSAKAYELPVNVVKRHGKRQLVEEPRLCIGTIHSVKGGEADVVVLYPDLSKQGGEHWMSGSMEDKDATRRLFYVAATRARRRLVVCGPAGSFAYPIWGAA